MDDVTQKLEQMKGRTFLYRTNNHKVLSYRVEEEKITIVTDRDWIPIENIAELREFLPVDEGYMEVQQHEVAAIKEQRNLFTEISRTIMENIDRVKKDKEFIPQAKAINNDLNTLINVAKLQIQLNNQSKPKNRN